MRQNVENSGKSKLIWLLILLFLVGGIVANSYYHEVAWALRVAGGLILTGVLLGLAALTPQGQKTWEFMRGSRAEMRKVSWPTRQETIQTAMVVVAMVVVASLVLWAFDSILLWLIGVITGQRGF
jgi:preprotein translocase subunit SecE